MTDKPDAPISRDPLALAALYRSGLGGAWNTQKQAVAALAPVRPKVTAEILIRAVGVSKLPEPVLSLFNVAGILNQTARELCRLARKHGTDALSERALHIDPRGKTWRQIVEMLDGMEPSSPVRAPKAFPPLVLASEYKRGLAEGRWTSTRSAEAITGWGRARVLKAVAISDLPPQVLELFELTPITFDLGDILVRIQKAIGTRELATRAEKMLLTPRRRTTDEIVATLLQVRPEQGVELVVRREPTAMVFEFRVGLAETEELMVGTDELAALVQVSVMNMRFKRHVGSVSVRKKR
ncbi:hypothetical protein AWB81_07229 [Caballeronia arationis]|uniref:hypothetical protein n=1 Tax=Caballeronia arationis TaxID=1777142 RepID=UPI00074C7283|nr:hypothetical protein [Caballeronia arationis]SAL05603.1 hypothetical protein AWB81_07229 [Caballeronia arationis]